MKVEFDGELELITIDGVKMSLAVLASFAHPDPTKLYRMKRENDVVTVEVLSSELAAQPQPALPQPICASEFSAIPCTLQEDHAYSHMGWVNGVRIYWTDALEQCESLTMRNGTPADIRERD